MNDETIPTDEGRRRWPMTGGYHPDLSAEGTQSDRTLPCTCASSCPPRCAGECGCAACDFAFIEFCDAAGLYGIDGLTVPEEEALGRFRAG